MQNQPINQRSGIALVMVLGVLSLMVLMAVSFAISMRTERVAAGNQLDTVRARHLARVGLVRAMDQLYRECGRDLPDSNLVYQEWAVTNSYTLDPTNAPPVDLLKGSASNFVPRSLWDAAVAANDTNSPNSSNYWISIISDVKETNSNYGTTNLIGRVAFMILNCSGLLDVNFVGGADRGIGTNPVEIALTSLPEMSVAYTPILTNRADWKRFETLEELNELAGYESENFFIYSRAPPGYYTNNSPLLVGTQVNLAGGLSDIQARQHLITNAFANAGFSPDEAGLLFTNLLHYLDNDARDGPQYYDGVGGGEFSNAFVAPVAMINEIVLSNTVVLSGLNDPAAPTNRYDINTYLSVELWNPFVGSPLTYYSVDIPPGGVQLFSSPPGCVPLTFPAGAKNVTVNSRGFGVVTWPLSATNYAVPGDPLIVGISNFLIEVTVGGHTADRFVMACNRDFAVANTFPGGAQGASQSSPPKSLECKDPRFNWDPNDPGQWVLQDNHSSTGAINLATTTFWADPANQGCDRSPEMYVACTNQLHSVGELGYLAYSNWSTIKLCGPGAHPVLDYFAIETNCGDFVTNVAWRGRVNPGATNRDVLAAVFADMPADEYPEQAAPARLDWTQAGQVADFIIANGPYTNMSDVCRLDWQTFFADPAFSGIVTNELQREAFIRNTAGLLSTRGQVYTILIEAQVASGGNIPKNPSRQRAVAVVWRDAWTGEMIVRYLKWLPD